ncbi:MAG TPA: hypothetical protein VE973_03440 [Candidatus Limnocylindria bacterium]|nr:hypothetical protein [Candidatus Limnocylindria bacterium]
MSAFVVGYLVQCSEGRFLRANGKHWSGLNSKIEFAWVHPPEILLEKDRLLGLGASCVLRAQCNPEVHPGHTQVLGGPFDLRAYNVTELQTQQA